MIACSGAHLYRSLTMLQPEHPCLQLPRGACRGGAGIGGHPFSWPHPPPEIRVEPPNTQQTHLSLLEEFYLRPLFDH